MLVRFFFSLRGSGVPVTITEFLTLLEALRVGLSDASAERFYFLARTCLVKDERHYDRFDRAFAAHFSGDRRIPSLLLFRELPADWLAETRGEKPDARGNGGNQGVGRLAELDGDLGVASR